MSKKGGLTVLFYPSFDNSEEFTDHYYRMMWYLNPLRERIRRIVMPYEGEAPTLGELPYYMDPTIKHMADESGIANSVELLSAEHTSLLENAAREADIVLVWRVDSSTGDRVPDGPLKPVVVKKKHYFVDHKNLRYAGSFYLRLSSEICTNNATVKECRRKFKQIPSDDFSKTGYIYGTGPSLQAALDMDLSDGTSIVCNTIVKNKELMHKLKPPIITVADPIFHAGCSSYAGDLRRHLLEAMVEYDSYLIVPMRDYALYMANLNSSLQERIIGVPIIPPNIAPNQIPNLNLYKKFQVTPATSVLMLFLIPLAATFFEKTFMLGFDGRPLAQNDYFWKHDPASQLVDRMDDIQVAHPAFFAIDYHDFYLEHCRVVARWLDEAERQGKTFISLTPSYVPALKCRQAASLEISTESLARPIVSIVMPAFNASGSIADAIASIQSQSVIDWELLVVDDGSTDNTREIVQGLAETDPRIRLLQCKGKGVSDARNTGLDAARGEFITFLDADDFMYRDALERRVEALANKPEWNLVHCVTEIVDENSRKLGWQLGRMVEVTFKDMSGNPCHLNSLMGRSEVFKSVRFQSGLTNGEDWLFFSDIFRTGEVSHRIDNCSVAYVVRHDSVVCRDYLSHERKVLEVLNMIYSPARNNMPAASEFVKGLSSPPKEIVALRRKIGLLTWLLLEQRANDIAAVLSEFSAQALSALSRGEIRHQITYTAMRFYVCRQEELAKRLRKDKAHILRLFSETGVENSFPQYVRELKSLMRKQYIHEIISLRSIGLYQRLVSYLIMNYPSTITIGRAVRWGLTTLRNTFFGIGGIAILVIVALYIAGALVEPARWYLVGIASALLLLGGGLLTLFYARFVLNRIISDQMTQVSDINKQVSDINKALHESEAALKKEISELNVGNFPLFQQANRRLTKQDLKHFAEEWVPKLGINLNYAAMGYIAHRICLTEDTCIGRLAGSIETMLLRVLVARSVKEPNLEVLEIGTLFGVGVAMIHENCLGLFNKMHFTVIDPLIGHIGPDVKGPLDSWIKAPATREIFIHNMQRMNIPESDYTIIQKLSTEGEAIEQASKRHYNILIIDGDHSDFGVRNDFYNYRHLVKHGGYIIFDDYGNPRWPGLTDFVDKEVAGMPGLEFVGTDVYSAVFRVIAPQDLTKQSDTMVTTVTTKNESSAGAPSLSLKDRNTVPNLSFDYPKQVSLETAAICNAHCDFCPQDKIARRGHIMEMELIEKIISELSEIPPSHSPEIATNGVNEPLADKRIFNVLDLIYDKLPNAKIYFVTNGNLLSRRAITELSKHNLSKLCISLNFCDKKTYEHRTGLKWEKTLAAMNILHEKTASGEFRHPVYISRVQDESEYDTVFANWVEVNYPAFRYWPKRAGDWLGAVPNLSHRSHEVRSKCPQWHIIHIASTGAVQRCCMDADAQYPWGNVETMNLLDIFNQDEWLALRRGQRSRFEVHPCNKCTYY